MWVSGTVTQCLLSWWKQVVLTLSPLICTLSSIRSEFRSTPDFLFKWRRSSWGLFVRHRSTTRKFTVFYIKHRRRLLIWFNKRRRQILWKCLQATLKWTDSCSSTEVCASASLVLTALVVCRNVFWPKPFLSLDDNSGGHVPLAFIQFSAITDDPEFEACIRCENENSSLLRVLTSDCITLYLVQVILKAPTKWAEEVILWASCLWLRVLVLCQRQQMSSIKALNEASCRNLLLWLVHKSGQ